MTIHHRITHTIVICSEDRRTKNWGCAPFSENCTQNKVAVKRDMNNGLLVEIPDRIELSNLISFCIVNVIWWSNSRTHHAQNVNDQCSSQLTSEDVEARQRRSLVPDDVQTIECPFKALIIFDYIYILLVWDGLLCNSSQRGWFIHSLPALALAYFDFAWTSNIYPMMPWALPLYRADR